MKQELCIAFWLDSRHTVRILAEIWIDASAIELVISEQGRSEVCKCCLCGFYASSKIQIGILSIFKNSEIAEDFTDSDIQEAIRRIDLEGWYNHPICGGCGLIRVIQRLTNIDRRPVSVVQQ